MGKFEIFKSTNDDFYFRLKAGNGEIILSSDSYVNKSGVDNGVKSVKENGTNDKNYERLIAKNDKYYFNLKAANGLIIGTSQMYIAEGGRETGIESVKNNAPKAEIIYM